MVNEKGQMQVTVVLAPMDFTDEFSERILTLTPDSPSIKIGRSSKSGAKNFMSGPTNAFIDSPVMSREHAKMWMVDHHLCLEDVGSLHGTFINQKRLEKGVPYPFDFGAVVTFGCQVTRGVDSFPPRSFRMGYKWEQWSPPTLPTPKSNSLQSVFAVPECPSDDEIQAASFGHSLATENDEAKGEAFRAAGTLPSETTPSLYVVRNESVELVSVKEMQSISRTHFESGTPYQAAAASAGNRTIEVPESDSSPSEESDSDEDDGPARPQRYDAACRRKSSLGLADKVENAKPIDVDLTDPIRLPTPSAEESYGAGTDIDTEREPGTSTGSKENPLVILDEAGEVRRTNLPMNDDDKPGKHPALSISHVLIPHDQRQTSSEASSLCEVDPRPRDGVDSDTDTEATCETSSSEDELSDDDSQGRIQDIAVTGGEAHLAHTQEDVDVLAEPRRRMSLAFVSSQRAASPRRDIDAEDDHITTEPEVTQQDKCTAPAEIVDHCTQPPAAPAEIDISYSIHQTRRSSVCAYKNSSSDLLLFAKENEAASDHSPTEEGKITNAVNMSHEEQVYKPFFACGYLSPPEPLDFEAFFDEQRGRESFEPSTNQAPVTSATGSSAHETLSLPLFDQPEDVEPYRRPTHSLANPTRLTSMKSANNSTISDADAEAHRMQPYLPVSETRQLPVASPATKSLKRKRIDEAILPDEGQRCSGKGGDHMDLGNISKGGEMCDAPVLISKPSIPKSQETVKKTGEGQGPFCGPPPRKRVRTADYSKSLLDSVKSTVKMAAGAAVAGFGVFAYLAISNPDPI